MQIREIEYIVAIVECGSFSRAAEKLFVSQPALSQQIAHLEKELQVRLFNREKKVVTPTAACKALLEDGRLILELNRRIQERMAAFADLRDGDLGIAIAPFYHKSYLAPLIIRFQHRYPQIKIRVVEAFSNEQSVLLRDNKVDLSITSLPLRDSKFTYKTLFEEDILLAVPREHPINEQLSRQAKPTLEIADLALLREEKFVMYQEGRHLREMSLAMCHQAGFSPAIVYETQSSESISELIAQGMGLGFVPRSTVNFCHPDRRPRYYELRSELATQTFALVYRPGDFGREAQAFYNLLYERQE